MLKAKELPGVFWGEAVTTVVYLLNRSSSKSVGGGQDSLRALDWESTWRPPPENVRVHRTHEDHDAGVEEA